MSRLEEDANHLPNIEDSYQNLQNYNICKYNINQLA